jgi:hypothetical protein
MYKLRELEFVDLNAEKVFVANSQDGWEILIPMVKYSNGRFARKIDLPDDTLYKVNHLFFVW